MSIIDLLNRKHWALNMPRPRYSRDLDLIIKRCPPQSNRSSNSPPPLVSHSVSSPSQMDNAYSNTADFASTPWPDPLRDWVIGDTLYFPDFNVPEDDAIQPSPTTEVEAFTNLQAQVDYTNQVSQHHV